MANLSSPEETDYIYVSVGLTKNLGNYESLRIDASARKAISALDDKDAAWAELWNDVEAQVEAKIAEADSALKEA